MKSVLLVVALIGLFLIRFYTLNHSFKEGDRIRITGSIQEDPLLIEGRQRVVVAGVKAYLPRFPEFQYGDRVVVEGVATSGNAVWPAGIALRSNAGWYLKDPEIVYQDAQKGIGQSFLEFRERALDSFGKFLPEPHASLLKGIVLGTKSSLDSEFFEALRKTGTLHVVVASGSNIAIFAGGLLGFLSVLLGRKRAIWPALALVWLYVFLVGWQPPIVRAGIMGSIAFLAQSLGKEFDAWRALLISAGGMLLVEPQWLFDLGFQLSFAATAGILSITPIINRFFRRIEERDIKIVKGMKENFTMSLGAQIAVTPILLFSFGQVSVIGPLVNAIILWTVPFIMIGGMFIALLGLLFKPLGQIAAWFIWLPLEYFVRIINIFS